MAVPDHPIGEQEHSGRSRWQEAWVEEFVVPVELQQRNKPSQLRRRHGLVITNEHPDFLGGRCRLGSHRAELGFAEIGGYNDDRASSVRIVFDVLRPHCHHWF